MTAMPASMTGQVIEAYQAPETLEDALRAIADGAATVLAGGTDLKVQTETGRKHFAKRLVNIRRVDALRGIVEADGRIRIGALVTMTELLNDPFVKEKAPVLAEMADKFASNQIRNAATVGGNICNASPAGDSIQPLMALGADVELASWDGSQTVSRSVPLDAFFTGPGKTVCGANELVTGCVVRNAKRGLCRAVRQVRTAPGTRNLDSFHGVRRRVIEQRSS